MNRAFLAFSLAALLTTTAQFAIAKDLPEAAAQTCLKVDTESLTSDRKLVISSCTKALADKASDPVLQTKYFMARAWAEFHLVQNAKAIADTNAALAISPKAMDARLLRGLAQEDRYNYAAALGDIEAVLAAEPENLKALIARSRIRYTYQEDPKGAKADIDKALQAAPKSPEVLRGQAELVGHTSQKNAEDILRKALDLDPNDLRTLVALGDCLQQVEKKDEAAKIFDRAVASYPTAPYAYRARVWNRADNGDLKGAMSDVDAAMRLDADAPSTHLARGYVLVAQEQDDQAIVALNRTLSLNPESSYAYQLLTEIYRHKDNISAALKAADDGLRLTPKDANLLFSRALALHAKGDFEAEQKAYDKVISIAPSAPAYYNRGVLLSGKDEYKLALEDFESALKLDPKDTDTLINKGISLERLAQTEEAIKVYDALIAQDPTSAKYQLIKGNAYLDSDQAEKASKAYQEAVKLSPKLAEAHRRLAEAYVDLENEASARAEFTTAIKLDGKDEWAWVGLGKLNMLGDQWKDARGNFDRALQINPKNTDALARRGVLKWWDDKSEAALIDLTAAIDQDPEFVYALNYRGLVYRGLDKLDEAMADYDKAIALSPDFDAPYYNRADVFVAKDRYDRAIRDLNVSLKLSPNDALTLRRRGYVFYLMRDYLRALEDLDASILADPKDSIAFERRADVKTELGDAAGAKADLAAAKALEK